MRPIESVMQMTSRVVALGLKTPNLSLVESSFFLG